MGRKIQVPAIGGLRKVIQPSATAGTTIAEFGSQSITLAQLKAALGVTSSSVVSTASASSGSSASLVLGPGLSGGGTLVGAVNVNLTAPIPAFIGDDPQEGEPGPPGPPGVAGAAGTKGANGPAIWMLEDPVYDEPIAVGFPIVRPAGNNGQIQYSNNGTFAASAYFTYNGTTTLTMGTPASGTIFQGPSGIAGTVSPGAMQFVSGNGYAVGTGANNAAGLQFLAGSGYGSGSGGSFQMVAGSCNGTGGNGGNFQMNGGVGGSTSGNGGYLNITAGDANSGATNGTGGHVYITAGGGAGNASGGAGAGGNVVLTGGNVSGSGFGGSVSLVGGNNYDPYQAGSINLTAGSNGDIGTGGSVNITLGNGAAGVSSNGTYSFTDGNGTVVHSLDTNGTWHWSGADADSSIYTVAPTTGSTVTLPTQPSIRTLTINPAGTIATLTVGLPGSPVNGQRFGMATTQTITTLTLSPVPSGYTAGTLSPGTAKQFIYNSSISKWMPN